MRLLTAEDVGRSARRRRPCAHACSLTDLGGMLQSWKQFWCGETFSRSRSLTDFRPRSFTGGYIEVAISLPGDTKTLGLCGLSAPLRGRAALLRLRPLTSVV